MWGWSRRLQVAGEGSAGVGGRRLAAGGLGSSRLSASPQANGRGPLLPLPRGSNARLDASRIRLPLGRAGILRDAALCGEHSPRLRRCRGAARRRGPLAKAEGGDGSFRNGHGSQNGGASRQGGGTPPGSEGEAVPGPASQGPSTPPRARHRFLGKAGPGHHEDHSNMVFLLRLPFLYAHTLAKTNKKWLQKRHRSRWWKRGVFPRVPRDTVEDVVLKEVPELVHKMAPLGVLFFCATFNLCILQNLKDSLIVTRLGAETLPFLASLGVLPLSVVFMGFYNKLVSRFPFKSVFYLAVAPLVAAYTIFSYAIFPMADFLHPHGFFNAFASVVPIGLHGALKVVENWTFSSFFCVAELWGAVVISVLFWSLANDVCTVDEAKTIYPLMGISANVALVIAGNFIKFVNKNFTGGSMQLSFNYLIGTVILMTAAMLGAKLYIDKTVKSQHQDDDDTAHLQQTKHKKKKKGTFREGFAVMRGSPKIMNLALLVIGYSVSHRLFDIAWKSHLSVVFPDPIQYQTALADVSVWTGAATIVTMLTGKFVFQYLGWGTAALATPVVMLLAGGVFFSSSLLSVMGGAGLAMAKFGAMAGNLTQVAGKAAKYSLFDPAKEMVYIEMDKEEKRKGKAAVDLVGSQVGKSGASWLSQGLLLCFGSVAASMPAIATVFSGSLMMWMVAVLRLKDRLKETEKERKAAMELEKQKEREREEASTKVQDPEEALQHVAKVVMLPGPTGDFAINGAATKGVSPNGNGNGKERHADSSELTNGAGPSLGKGRKPSGSGFRSVGGAEVAENANDSDTKVVSR